MQRRFLRAARGGWHLDSLELRAKLGFTVMTDTSLEERLQSFIESEGKSCSFDTGLKTPE